MRKKDIFYFTQGEKRGVLLLMILITLFLIGYITLSYMNPLTETIIVHDTIYAEKIPFPKVIETQTNKKKIKSQTPNPININSANSYQLEAIPGIGPILSKRIINYRDSLGGYYCIEQLAEIRGINTKKLNVLRQWLFIEPQSYTRIKINHVTIEKLKTHPYITNQQAFYIIESRKKNNQIKSIKDLESLQKFSRKELHRLEPYISFD